MSTTIPNLPENTEPPPGRPSRVWWLIVAALLLQLAVWTVWLVVASHHKVAEVPLAPQAHR